MDESLPSDLRLSSTVSMHLQQQAVMGCFSPFGVLSNQSCGLNHSIPLDAACACFPQPSQTAIMLISVTLSEITPHLSREHRDSQGCEYMSYMASHDIAQDLSFPLLDSPCKSGSFQQTTGTTHTSRCWPKDSHPSYSSCAILQ